MISLDRIQSLVYDSNKRLPDLIENFIKVETDTVIVPGAPSHYYRFLYHLCQELKPKLSVELGTYRGFGSLCIGQGNLDGKVITIDIAGLNLTPEMQNRNVEFWNCDSVSPIRPLENIDLLFIDTMHDGVMCEREYRFWSPLMSDNGIVLFDDINLNKEMRDFWDRFDPNGIKFEIPCHGDSGFGGVLLT